MATYKVDSNGLLTIINSDGGTLTYKGESIETRRDGDSIIAQLTYDGLYEYFDSYDTTQIFTLHNLRNCLLQKERHMINHFLGNCKKGLCNKDSDQTMDDFLLVSLFVIEQLICQNKYDEADRIVSQLESCGICQKTIKHTCNCNG